VERVQLLTAEVEDLRAFRTLSEQSQASLESRVNATGAAVTTISNKFHTASLVFGGGDVCTSDS
jgi:hypothetical protein